MSSHLARAGSVSYPLQVALATVCVIIVVLTMSSHLAKAGSVSNPWDTHCNSCRCGYFTNF
ncbi:hypothetical protein BC938DRAFT_473255, partial [Jimgerdemannia flammicorona]